MRRHCYKFQYGNMLLHFRQKNGNETDMSVLYEGKDPLASVSFLHNLFGRYKYIVMKTTYIVYRTDLFIKKI